MSQAAYQSAAVAAAQRYGVPPDLFLRLVGVESSWNPSARSSVGALGLTQLMPGTAAGLGVTNPLDPIQNLNGGAKYLRQQFDHFGRWDLALAAYNAGPNAATSAVHGVSAGYVRTILGSTDPTARPVPGGGGGIGAPGTNSISGLYPLFGSNDHGVTVGRSDYGVDFGYGKSTRATARAVASGTVVKLGSGWGHVAVGSYPGITDRSVVVKLDQPYHGYQYVYYAEGTPAAGLAVGSRVAAGDPVMLNPGEFGVITTPNTSTNYQTPQPTSAVTRQLLQQAGLTGGGLSDAIGGSTGKTPSLVQDAQGAASAVGSAVTGAITGGLSWIAARALTALAYLVIGVLAVWLVGQGASRAFGTPAPSTLARSLAP